MVAQLMPQPHPILACAEQLTAAINEVRDVQPVYMSPAEKKTAVVELNKAAAMLAELQLRIVATAEDEANTAGARDVGAWTAHLTRADVAAARADARLADALDRRWTQTAVGMAEGRVSLAQAQVVVHALEALPSDLDPDLLKDAEARLIKWCAEFHPAALRRLGRRILEVVAPDIAEAELAKRLEDEEHRAREKCRLTLRTTGEGSTRLSGLLPDAEAARLRTYLEAFTSPRKHHDAPGALGGEEDRIPYPRRLGQAFCALLEHLDPAKLPQHGGDATTVMVTIGLDSLRSELGAGSIVGGESLSATAIRRLACNAAIIPVVLGGKGEILDLGRSRRLFSPAQRRAIRLRDQRCRAEGCAIPAAWCEAHHLEPWAAGGKTDLDDGVLHCSFHHHRAHDPRYTTERLPNGDIRFRRRT
ncbi:HNH endonuclease signature motif containing protein [Nocardioides bizhenqiangii]|uniref:DUF222 domain-containing protein n=1 Tax=Nocardioides bizhenqiangii TaxID=3095076 RepID=A0ABZ0ZLV1_9ACTN|nr:MULTISPECIES: DUF222 domain-containing protein [unclassified Nocardioides]MDZ5620809.1 DUF222 domain-containing protein [Nocardioides sp. HM23]WQQ25173.1 DUF222 domain-containing protein [Nocardioides sp. HM61]